MQTTPSSPLRASASAMLSAGLLTLGLGGAPVPAAAACSPCAPKTRRSGQANPCAARSTCKPSNPCSAKATCGPKNPCGAKNPCAARNPCAAKAALRPAGYRPRKGSQAELVAAGKTLFSDTKLSTNGMSCNTCHQGNAAFQATFAKPYPHAVGMTSDMGIKQVHADEMVQFCLITPMAAKPLPWNSRELAALTAYVVDLQKGFKPTAAGANPCAAKNPCATKNPCAAKNACGAKNPCTAKPTCAPRNPCAAKKSPCAAKTH